MDNWNLQTTGWEKEQKTEMMAKLFPNLMKTINSQIQVSYKAQNHEVHHTKIYIIRNWSKTLIKRKC